MNRVRIDDCGLLRIPCGVLLILIAGAMGWAPAYADMTVGVSAPGGSATQTLSDAGGSFSLNLPLNKNMVNNITVTAQD